MTKIVRVPTDIGWKSVELSDEEVGRVVKENLDYNIKMLVLCLGACVERSGMGLRASEDSKIIYQSAFAKPLHYALEEFAMSKEAVQGEGVVDKERQEPTPKQISYVEDLSRRLNIPRTDLFGLDRNEVSELIKRLKERLKAGGKDDHIAERRQ